MLRGWAEFQLCSSPSSPSFALNPVWNWPEINTSNYFICEEANLVSEQKRWTWMQMDGRHLMRTLISRDGLAICSCGCCRIRISAPFWWAEIERLFQRGAPNHFFSPPQMSRLIYFNESFWLRRECSLAVQLLLIHLAAVWMFSPLWVCCFLRLYWMAKEQLRPGLVKMAQFAYSGHFIDWHACDGAV